VRVFLDTSAIFTMMDADDPRQPQVAKAFAGLDEPAVTTNYVLTETIALVDRRLGRAAMGRLIADISENVETIWIDASIHEAAFFALTRARAKTSFVDLVSFETMRKNRIRTALALDPDFAREGFRTIP
jgi:predicted nucleic acid-binding protein